MAQDSGECLGIHPGWWRAWSGEGSAADQWKSQSRESGLGQQSFHPVVAAAWHDRVLRAEWVGEDPLTDGRSLPLRQELHRAGRQSDDPSPFSSLGVTYIVAAAPFPMQSPADGECPFLFIEVAPHQPAQFSPAAVLW